MANLVILGHHVNNDDVYVEGTVNGTPYTVHCWLSHLQTLSTAAQKLAYVQSLFKTAYLADNPTLQNTFDGTYTI